jgi:glutaredoxin
MAARDEVGRTGDEVTYVDVQNSPDKLQEMLAVNGGVRQVPTIVEDGKVKIGFGGT